MPNSNRQFVDYIDNKFSQLAAWSVSHRLWVVFFCLCLLSAGLYFASKVQSDNSLQAYFDQQDPTYIAYGEYLETFSSDEVTYILYRVPTREHGVFDYEAMQNIATLTMALEDEVPFVREATSLTNVEFMHAEGDSITVDELMLNFPESQDELLDYKTLVLDHPLYVNYLVNADASYAAIILEMERSSVDTLEQIIYDPAKGVAMDNLYPQVSEIKIREILARSEYKNIEFFLTGDVPMNAAYNNLFMQESGIGTLITLALLAVLSFIFLRVSWVGLLGPVVVVVLSIILVLGLMGAAGWVLGMFFGIVPTLLCAVGVAQSVHIILEYQRANIELNDKKKAVQVAITKVGGVCLLAALTTALGMLVMMVSKLKVLSEMAVYASAGVMFTFILSVTLLVVVLSGGKNPTSKIKQDSHVRRAINAVVEYCIQLNLNHTRLLLSAGAALMLVSFIGLSLVKIDFNFLTEFKPHVQWRQHTERAEEIMGGILGVTYIVDTHKADGLKDPALLKALDKLQIFVKTQPYVKNAYSIVDIQKDINRSFHGDDKAWYRVANSRELIAQYFLVYEISGGEELEDFVSSDFSRAVLELRVEITKSSNVKALMNTIDQYIEQNPLPGADVKKTGIGLMWVKIAEYIGETQLYSYSLLFLGIAVFLCIVFGSVKVGLLTMIPNIMPVVVVLGFMGWTKIDLDYMKLLLATIAIGIAVDDSIHLVTRFRRRFFELGNYQAALEQSMRDVGPALIITTLILVGAFSCYLFSDLQIIASFGMLLSMAIFVALLADMLFMPALLLWLKPFGKEFSPNDFAK